MTITVPRLNRLPAQERGITIADFLVPIRVAEGIGVRARHVALILAGTLLIAAAAQVRLYLPDNPIPITGQTFAVLLAGGALGFRRVVAASTLYLLLGLVGLPVYAGGRHGLDVFIGLSGGYLIGFIVATAIVGRLAELGWDRSVAGSIGAMVLGNLSIYVIAVPWWAVVAGVPLDRAVADGFVPFVPGDILKVALAAAAFPAAWWLVGRRPGDR